MRARLDSLTPAKVAATALLLACAAACSSSGGDATDTPVPPAPPSLACAAGETADGDACVAAGILACPAGMAGADGACKPSFPATCAPGTAKLLGESSCVALGPTTCLPGAAKDPSGWGCTATVSAACAGADRAVPGGTCVAVGACPSALPAGAVRFVDATFTTQIDATHFASLGAALAGAPPGTVLSVAAGTYHETIDVPAGLSVIGACASDVVIEPAPGATDAAVTASSGAVTLRGLTLRGAAIGLSVKGATVTADALVIEQAHGEGVNVQSGSLAMKSSVVRATAADPPVRDDGTGIFAAGGTVTLDGVTIDGSTGTGLSAWRTSKVVAHDLVVSHTAKSASGILGWAVDVESGGSFDGTRVVIVGASFAGVAVTDPGSHVTLEDAIVTGVALASSGPGGPTIGAGVAVTGDAAVDVHHVSIGDTAGASMLVAAGGSLVADGVAARGAGAAGDAVGGLYASGAKVTARLSSSVITAAMHDGIFVLDSAAVTVDGVLVSDTKPDAESSSGIGAFISGKAKLEGRRLTLERNATSQLAALGGSSVALESLATLDAHAGATDNFSATGIGVLADQASTVKLTNAYLGQSTLLGVSLRRASSIEATGLVIDGVALAKGADSAYGLMAIEASTATLTDFAITGAHGASLVIGEKGTTATLTRGTLRDPAIDAKLTVGRGLSMQAGANVTLAGVRILGSKGTSIYMTTGATASLAASVIDGTEPAGDGRFGDAVEVVGGALLRVDRSVVRNAHGAALVFAGGTGSVAASLIEHNAVGIHAQDGTAVTEVEVVPDELAEDTVAVSASTQFLENQSRVGSGEIPLPEPLSLE